MLNRSENFSMRYLRASSTPGVHSFSGDAIAVSSSTFPMLSQVPPKEVSSASYSQITPQDMHVHCVPSRRTSDGNLHSCGSLTPWKEEVHGTQTRWGL